MARGPITKILDATATTLLGGPDPGFVGRWAIQFDSDSFVGTGVTIEGRILGGDGNWFALAYIDFETGTLDTAVITGDALVLVDASGLEIRLNTTWTSGALNVTCLPLVG